MALFNFFGTPERREITHKPIYYDERQEECRRIFGAVDGTMEKEKKEGTYVPGSYIRSTSRKGAGGNPSSSGFDKAKNIIKLVTLVLVVVVLVFVVRFYMMLYGQA